MRVLSIAVAFLVVALTVPLVTAFADPPPPPPYVVIVHPSNPNARASRRFIADAFLKKTTRWPDGEVIRPVDLGAESSARGKFSDDVLNRSVAAVRSYWQQMIFSGRDVPPPELGSEDEVVKHVLQNIGAVGYVSGSAHLGGTKVVVIQ